MIPIEGAPSDRRLAPGVIRWVLEIFFLEEAYLVRPAPISAPEASSTRPRSLSHGSPSYFYPNGRIAVLPFLISILNKKSNVDIFDGNLFLTIVPLSENN
ncbi:MAG: hypothetical protein QXJ48_05700 [Candidatus Korarchaeum sp.]